MRLFAVTWTQCMYTDLSAPKGRVKGFLDSLLEFCRVTNHCSIPFHQSATALRERSNTPGRDLALENHTLGGIGKPPVEPCLACDVVSTCN